MADNINTQLQVQDGETIDAYKARVASMQTPSGAVSSAGFDPNTVASMMQDTIGSVSSSNDTIDASIGAAIQSQKEAAAANAAALESQYSRESSYQANDLNSQRTALMEAGRGGAIGSYALQAVDTQIEKSLRDLEQRKNELVLQGNAAAASKISELQVQQLQFKQEAQQKVFSNLLQMGNYAINLRSASLAERAQSFQETNAISSVALQYGLTVKPGETIEQIVSRAAPLASEKQKLELNKTLAEIAKLKADANLSIAQANEKAASGKTDPATITAMALAANRNPNILLGMTNMTQRSLVENEMARIQQHNVTETVMDYVTKDVAYEDAYSEVLSNPYIENKVDAITALKKAYEIKDEIQTKRTLASDVGALSGAMSSSMNSIGEYVYGDKWIQYKGNTLAGKLMDILK